MSSYWTPENRITHKSVSFWGLTQSNRPPVTSGYFSRLSVIFQYFAIYYRLSIHVRWYEMIDSLFSINRWDLSFWFCRSRIVLWIYWIDWSGKMSVKHGNCDSRGLTWLNWT
jgi:hypothetical protein